MLVSRGIVMSMKRQLLSFRRISCDGPVSLEGHVPQNGDAVLLGGTRGFILIPSFFHLNTSLQIVQCMCEAAFFWLCMYTVLNSSGKPVTRWPMVPSKRPHSLHFGFTSVFMRMLDWYQRFGRLWFWAAMIKPSVYALRTVALSQQWGLSWFTSTSFSHCGYLAWSAFDSHLDPSCWRPWSLVLAFVLQA